MFEIDPNFPVGNAAGWCKTVNDVRALAASAAAFIIVGGYTPKKRDGNPGNTFNGDSVFSLNSLGLPCGGTEYLELYGHEMVKIAHNARKNIILNINGFTPEDFAVLARLALRLGFDGVEVNLGCPNVVDGARRKPIASANVTLSRNIIAAVTEVFLLEIMLIVKVSPTDDPEHIINMANMLRQFPVYAVTTMNTSPNCLLFDDAGKTVIQTPDDTGWAGGAGYSVKARALGQVSQWSEALETLGMPAEVWGAGGVACDPRGDTYGKDVRDMLWAGATLVQVGTSYCVHGPKIFGDIATQFINLKE